jgi:pantoate--beta-alanine ligase
MIKIFEKRAEIYSELKALREKAYTIGFVPTMGALHDGHLSLIKRAVEENDVSVSSVFVNPIQFNNREDLEKYPRHLDDDLMMLDRAGCDMVFAPSVEEMYPETVSESYDFGPLEHVMEGEKRPGHFNGVAVVVRRLFDICIPHHAYFGEKDYQQLLIIRELVKMKKIDVSVIGCPIVREADGLAMSSRNVRLTIEERSLAPVIFKTLSWIKQQSGKTDIELLLDEARTGLKQYDSIRVEYVDIVDEQNLVPVRDWNAAAGLRAFVALFLGEVRLIDNMKIK